jgi:hypothetical protein
MTDDLFDEGWAGTKTTDQIAAFWFGALTVATGAAWWLHHTFVVPTRPRRTP